MRPLVLILFLVGCGTNVTPSAPVSKADIAAVEVTLTAAVNAANTCLNLKAGPCTSPAVRTPMIADIHAAHDTFKQVQRDNNAGLPVSLTALTAVLSRLATETPVAPAAVH